MDGAVRVVNADVGVFSVHYMWPALAWAQQASEDCTPGSRKEKEGVIVEPKDPPPPSSEVSSIKGPIERNPGLNWSWGGGALMTLSYSQQPD